MQVDFASVDFGQEEIEAVNKVMAGTSLASGRENELFEKEFSAYVGTKFSVCVNSGSSANLLALASLQLSRNAKVLTSACGFPATLSPILHLGLEPYLVDYELETHNIDVKQVIKNLHKVSAVILAHTMGSPADIVMIKTYADMLGVPIIEDCCEALGSSVSGRMVGSFGRLGTFSFYPAHQMTALGGGGMVVTDDEGLYRRMKSLRDWGKMYDWDSSLGGNDADYTSSIGYHRGYTYETIGWNFKLPEANAAFGRVQLGRLEKFVAMRKYRYEYLRAALSDIGEFLPIREIPAAHPSWFGYIMTLRDGSAIKRNEFSNYLTAKGIKNRPFFAGNILSQPAFSKKLPFSEFPVADKLMKDTVFIGCHTKLTGEQMDYVIKTIREYVDANSGDSKLQRDGQFEGVHSISSSTIEKAG